MRQTLENLFETASLAIRSGAQTILIFQIVRLMKSTLRFRAFWQLPACIISSFVRNPDKGDVDC